MQSLSRAERRRAAKLARKTDRPATGQAKADLKAMIEARYRAGDLAEARRLTERLVQHGPPDPATLSFAGMLARKTGDLAGAAVHITRAHGLRPTAATAEALADSLHALIHARLADGDSASVPPLTAQYLNLRPQSTEAVAFEAFALLHQGEREMAKAALGMEALVEIRDLAPPAGWSDVATFNADLAQEMARDPSMAVPDTDSPTYHNQHLKITAPLDIARPGPIAALTGLIEASVAAYREERAAVTHPFFTRWPKRSRLEAWGTLLEGEGTVDAHIHLEGYLGMVYYPELPPEVVDGQGWLELGRPPEDFPLKVEPLTQLIEPKVGRLVLFPGYLFHRTTPFQSIHRRISIAYDVVAA